MNQRKEKSSRARNALIAVLKHSARPMSLDELLELIKVQYPKTAFSTIYRIMKRLEEESKVLRVDWRERGSRYEWADRLHHHHIHCTICGNSTDIDDTVFSFNFHRIGELTGYQIGSHDILLEGVCSECQDKAKNR